MIRSDIKSNPYTRVFGKEPLEVVPRIVQIDEMMDSFTAEIPTQQVYMITGVRGSGKTVLMTEIVKRLQEREGWIVIELNPAKDLLEGFASRLYEHQGLASHFREAKINLTAFGIGAEIKGISPITDIEVAIEKMLLTLKKKDKRVLVAIDEAASTKEMQIFASAFQILIRKDLPLYLIMTGLFENIDELQNDKILTFLHRAPKIKMNPLNSSGIAMRYKATFELTDDEAREMAALTMGYSFAFQVLGYFTYIYKGDYQAAIPETRQYLEEYVYDKIWSELSQNDKKVVCAIASVQSGRIKDVREKLDMESNEFSPYKMRLLKKGIVDGNQRGYVALTLPFFREFALDREYEENM